MVTKKREFRTGQYVVYPTQGVGKLVKTEDVVIAGQKVKMLVIDFPKNSMTLRVPLDRAEISGLRPIVSQRKIMEAINLAKERSGAKRMIWSRRAAIYEENINSGDPMKIAEVIRDLQRRSVDDPMTFSGRQLYFRALERMAQEFAAINNIEVDKAEEKIEDILEIPKDFETEAEEVPVDAVEAEK